MSPLLIAILLGQGQAVPKGSGAQQNRDEQKEYLAKRSAANNKFFKLINDAKTFSVDIEITQDKNPVLGHGTLVVAKPGKLYYHLSWGKNEYTYAILNGEATEVDKANQVYDEYSVPALIEPEANGSDWVPSFFPTVFISEQNLLPPNSFDADGHLLHYAIGSGSATATKKNILRFSNFKTNEVYPDSKFVLHPGPLMEAVSTPRPAPPLQIDSVLPNLKLVDAAGKPTDLLRSFKGKPCLVALLEPQCAPSVGAIALLKKLKDVGVVVLNDASTGKGLASTPLVTLHDPSGGLSKNLRAPMTPLFYLVDGSGKIANVWYGFDRDQPNKFEKQVSTAIAELKG